MKQKENNREKRNVRMRVKLLGAVFFILHSSFFISPSSAQTFENRFTRSLSDVFEDVQKQFGIRLKYDIDTTGLKLPYADFRIRAYSVEETLKNLCAPFDFVPWDQGKGLWKIKRFEYPRRKPEARNSSTISTPYIITRHSGKPAATRSAKKYVNA